MTLLSKYIAEHRDEYEFSDTGDMVVTIESSMLSGVSVDTYSTHTPDFTEECEIDYWADLGNWVNHPIARRKTIEIDSWDDLEFNFNMKAVLNELSEAAGQALMEEYSFINNVKVTDTYSPAAYNFATDSFTGEYYLDIDEMLEVHGDIDIEVLQNWAEKEYESRSGFISYIPEYFERNYSWALIWAYLDRLLIADGYDDLLAVGESTSGIYLNALDTDVHVSVYRKAYEAITGEVAPETVTDDESLHDALPAWQTERLF